MGVNPGDRIRWLVPEVIQTDYCSTNLEGELATVLDVKEKEGLFLARFKCDKFGLDDDRLRTNPRIVELETEGRLWEPATPPSVGPRDFIDDTMLPTLEQARKAMLWRAGKILELTPVAEVRDQAKGRRSFTLKMGAFDGPELIAVIRRRRDGRMQWGDSGLERHWRWER